MIPGYFKIGHVTIPYCIQYSTFIRKIYVLNSSIVWMGIIDSKLIKWQETVLIDFSLLFNKILVLSLQNIYMNTSVFFKSVSGRFSLLLNKILTSVFFRSASGLCLKAQPQAGLPKEISSARSLKRSLHLKCSSRHMRHIWGLHPR